MAEETGPDPLVSPSSQTDFGSSRSPADRLVNAHIGPNGASADRLAEHFRLLVGRKKMRSTACYLQDTGSKLVITDGRGFGHGVGLCQWGTQAQALQGRSAAQILKFYYPGANLTKAY